MKYFVTRQNNIRTTVIKTLVVILTALAPVFLSVFGAGIGKEIMVFNVSDASLLGMKANTALAATIGPTTCSGTNYVNGTAMTQPAAGTGNRRYCPGVYSCNPEQPTSCVNPVTGKDMPAGYTCRVGVYSTGQANLAGRKLPLNVIDCARQGVEWRFTQPAGGNRMPNIGTAIDGKTGCYTEYTWFSGGAKASGAGDPRLICPTAKINGSYVYGPVTTGDDNTGSGSGQGSSGGSASGGSSSALNQVAREPFGEIEKVNCTTVEGWAMDPTKTTTPVSLRAYVQKKGTTIEQPLSITIVANISRPDLFTAANAAKLKVDATNFAKHGFKFDLPIQVVEEDKLVLYVVKPGGSWNPLLAEQKISCSGTTASSTSPARQTLNSVVNVLSSGSGATGGSTSNATPRVESSVPKTWAEWEAYCKANPAQVCLATPSDGGPSCAVDGRGQTAEMTEQCRHRVENCKGRGGIVTGFCDPDKITQCREAGIATDWAQRVDADACSEYLWDHGCSADPAGCKPGCILGTTTEGCAGTPPPSGSSGCTDSRGMPIRCTTPPEPVTPAPSATIEGSSSRGLNTPTR